MYQCLFGKLIFNDGSDPGRILTPQIQQDDSKKLKAVSNIEKIQPAQQGRNSVSKGKTTGAEQNDNAKNALLITADDILMEYVKRLSECVKNISSGNFKQMWRRSILNFINSSMWKKPLDLNQPYFSL